MNIKVVNKRGLSAETGWSDIYVGRPSALGNPFAMKHESDRLLVVAKYRKWLWTQINEVNSPARAELIAIAKRVQSGESIRLVCWCNPLDCHGNVLLKAASWLIENNQGYF